MIPSLLVLVGCFPFLTGPMVAAENDRPDQEQAIAEIKKMMIERQH